MLYLSPLLFLISVSVMPLSVWAMTHYQGRLQTQIRNNARN
jgi:hypothetical protein